MELIQDLWLRFYLILEPFVLFFHLIKRTQGLQLPYLAAIAVFFLFAEKSTAQQCTLPSRIFLPTADEAKFEQLGAAIDVDGDYMVAGMHENSSQQVYSG